MERHPGIELGENEVPMDFVREIRKQINILSVAGLNPGTPSLELGFMGEFGFSRWLTKFSIEFDHRTVSNPTELLADFILFDSTEEKDSIRVDVKTSWVRPPHVSRIISVEQFQSIPTHSDILLWAFYSGQRKSITIDSWTHVRDFAEAKLKSVSAPPDFPITNDPAIELDFTDTKLVYEIPSFLMRDIQDLYLHLKHPRDGVSSIQ
jgi:hypothetical protein